jgi:DNA polymerase-3 subunit gamma/tau
LDEVYRSGYDINQFYQDLVEHFRSLLMARILPEPSSVLDMADGEIRELKKQAEQGSPEDLTRLVSILLKAEEDILRSSLPRMGMEITLIKMAHLGRLEPLEKILERITSFEEARPSGPAARRAPAPNPPGKKVRTRPAEAPAPSAGPRPRIPWNAPDAWKHFVDTVRRDRAMTAALLEDVGQWEVNEDAVKVFCEKGTFLFDQLGSQETKTLLSKSVRDCFGEAVRFELCPAKPLNDSKARPSGAPEEGEAKARPSRTAVDEARNDQTVKTALEVFHAKIKDVKLFGSDTGEEEA